MYVGTSQFGEDNKSGAKAKPGFLKDTGSTMTPKTRAKPLDKKIKPDEKAKLLVRKKFEPSTTDTKLLKTEFLKDKYSWQVASLEKNLEDVMAKAKSADLYVDMLKQYVSLPVSGRRFVHSWIKEHETAIRKFKSGRELEKKVEELRAAIALADIRINYWNKLHGLKKSGVNVQGNSMVKQVKPVNGSRIESGVYDTPTEMPAFQPELKKDPVKKAVKRSKRLMNLGEVDEGKLLLSPFLPMDMRKEVVTDTRKRMFNIDDFAEALPDDNHYFRIGEKLTERNTASIKKSRTSVDNYWEKKKIRDLQKEILQAKTAEEQSSKKAKEILSKIKKGDKASKLDTAVLGILLEAKPEKFVASATLMEGIERTFKRLTDIENKSVAKEADSYLKKEAGLADSLLKQLESKETKLGVLRGEPITKPKRSKVAPTLGNMGHENSTCGKLMVVLPWVVAAYLIYKIYKGR